MDARCWLSAGGKGSAIACVEVAGDVDGVLGAIGAGPVAAGAVRVAEVRVGAAARGEQEARDQAVVTRWATDRATVMPHGGVAVVRGLLAQLSDAGVAVVGGDGQARAFPEAEGDVERAMLDVLWRAASPAAVELLLDQPGRWARVDCVEPSDAARGRALGRLIEPALVVAVGPPNVGKSSLLNALAKGSVSIVADVPGTTRDHVGALIDLAGVVVRWVDTPGFERGPAGAHDGGERGEGVLGRAQRLAWSVAAEADVLVVCRDVANPAPPAAERLASEVSARGGAVVRLGLRSDLGASPGVDALVRLGGEPGDQDGALARAVGVIREAVVPARWIDDGLRWRFWAGCAGATCGG